MEIIETPWEQRNLGVKSSALIKVHKMDNTSKIKEALLNCKDIEYLEVHIDEDASSLINMFVVLGFTFIETMVDLECDLRKVNLNLFDNILEPYSYHLANQCEMDELYDTLCKGKIFTTDKIALNPRFGPKVAGRRYALWIKDETLKGKAETYIYTDKKRPLGFFTNRRISENKDDAMIGGLFDPKKSKGLGLIGALFLLKIADEKNIKKRFTSISSNNPRAMALAMTLGYKLKHMHYVLTKML